MARAERPETGKFASAEIDTGAASAEATRPPPATIQSIRTTPDRGRLFASPGAKRTTSLGRESS